jgi:hypothetical protein
MLHLAALSTVLLCAACKNHSSDQKSAPKLERSVFKLGDNLQLAIGPLELENVPINKAALRAKFPKPEAPAAGYIQTLHFFVPGETELRNPEKYHSLTPMDRGDENVVNVLMIEPWTKEMYQKDPVAIRDARLGWQTRFGKRILAGEKPEDILGMQCYRFPSLPGHWARRDCLVERAPGEWAIFEIYEIDPTIPNPLMRTRYFSKAYGGLTVAWVVYTKHAAKWREIDAKLWRLIGEWNIAEQP